MNSNYYDSPSNDGTGSRAKPSNPHRIPNASSQKLPNSRQGAPYNPQEYNDPRHYNNGLVHPHGSYYDDPRASSTGYPQGQTQGQNQFQISNQNNSKYPPDSQDFVELENLPAHVRANGGQEFQRPISPESQFSCDERNNLIRRQRGDSQYSIANLSNPNYAQLNNILPSHVKSAASPAQQVNYAQLQNVLPSHVKPSYVPQTDSSQFAAPSKGFNAMTYQTPSGTNFNIDSSNRNKKGNRSCFGLCLCSGKMCVIITTISTLAIGLLLFFLWMRRPGFAPSGDLLFRSSPYASTNESLSVFHAEVQYQIHLNNPNFYPLFLTKMNAKVFDGATGMQIGQGTLKNVYIAPLNEAFANLTLNLDYRVSSDQDKTWQDLMAACPLSPETVTRVPLTTRTQIEAYFNLFAWANFIPKDTLQRNMLCS